MIESSRFKKTFLRYRARENILGRGSRCDDFVAEESMVHMADLEGVKAER